MNDVFLSADIARASVSLSKQLNDMLELVGDDIIVSIDDRLSVHTRMQHFFNLKLKDPVEAAMLEIIITHAVAAEKTGPGSFELVLREVASRLGKPFVPTNASSGIISRRASESDVDTIVDRLRKKDSVVAEMFKQALALAGFGGRVIIEKARSLTPSVELTRGYGFDIAPAWPITARFDFARAFVIDGYVESVSEVHHLLEAAAAAKEHVVLFVRGLSDDVVHTLRVNFDRGTLSVVPVIVKFDLEGINTVNDLAIVTGCNLISSNKGDTISSVKFDEAPHVDSVLVYPTKVTVQNSSTARAVIAHVAQLRSKRSDTHVVEDVGTLLDKRVKSLSPNHVIVRIPDDKDFVRKSQAFDAALRTVKSIVDYGVTNEGKPAAAMTAAVIHAEKCVQTLAMMGAVIKT